MFNGLGKFLNNDISIDLGTANTLIYVRGQGVVLNEPSVVAIQCKKSDREYSNVVAVGHDAKVMLGKTPNNITTIRPLKDGVIADFHATEMMLQYFIKKICKGKLFNGRPRCLICVPSGSTQVERRAIRESALGAGAREVYLIEEPMAAAIGAGMPIDSTQGTMVVDIGGGTTEIAIISLNGIVVSSSVRIGGDRFDESIINHVRRKFGIIIGESSAEQVKKQIGCAYPRPEVTEIQVRGRDLAEGIPKTFTLTSKDAYDALQESLAGIIEGILNALESAPPELAGDIAEHGIVFTGGGSLLTDIEKLIQAKIGLPVVIAEDPLSCVAKGGGKALELMDQYGADIFAN